jgi:long-chain acyl-CoA synthetase
MSDPFVTPDMQSTRTEERSSEPTTDELTTQTSHPWLHHYQEGVPVHLSLPDHSLSWLLEQAAHRYPTRVALIYYGTKVTYAQLLQYTNRFASALLRLGVQKGDRVAVALPNIPQFPIAFYGALRAGAIVVPTNPLYTERELQHQLTDSGAKILIMLDSFYPRARTVRVQTSLEHIVVTNPADFLPLPLKIAYPLTQRKNNDPQPALTPAELASDASMHRMRDMLDVQTRGGVELFNLPTPARNDELAVLQYTGGTTGLSKGAMLSHRNLLANAMQTRCWSPRVRDGEETTLCVAPFFHAYGLTVGMNLSIFAAATMVLLPRFKTKDVLATIKRYHPTMFPGIPTMYTAIIREAGKDTTYLQSIKYCISGSAPLPAQVQEDFERITGGKVVEGYGLSEAAPVTHCNPFTSECRNGSIGLPLTDVTAAILNTETGQPVAVGEEGELVVKGPNIMQGYWQRDEETASIFRDGWLRTGDIGKMDTDGFFYIVERIKDMIIASGFNIYPREVEEVLYRHPAVAEAAVVGVPDTYRGETVAAFIVLKTGFTDSEETKQSILQFAKQELTAYKVPKRLEFRDSLPKSLVGKVLRRELRKVDTPAANA